MAHVSLLNFSASGFVPDQNAQLVGGDVGAVMGAHNGAPFAAFDDTDEAAIVSHRWLLAGYAGGTLKATIGFYMASNAADDIALDVFVEAVTPNADTIDLEAATGWDAANSGTMSLAGTTAGDPLALTVTLINKDGVVAGDLARFGLRRDCDSGDDDAAGDLYIASVEIWEDT